MPRDPGPPELPLGIHRSIERCIDGIQQLEILLLLQRNATRYWDAAAVAQSLSLPESQATDDLEALGRRGLLDVRIASVVKYCFSPVTPALALEATQIADAYKNHRQQLFALLTSRRRRSLKEFSEAFKITRDSEDG